MNQFKDMLSQLKPYSLGVVVIDKPETSDVIQVFPSEQLPFAEGDLSKNKRMQISASWIRIGDSNRFTSPDVYKGETVQIYRYANTEEYFWSDIMREPSLRKKERVIYAVSNIPDKGGVQSLDKSYFVEISTKDKRVHLHTADNDGELCTYDIVLDTSKGSLTVLDGKGNIITLDSSQGNLNFKLNGSLYGEMAKNVNIICENATISTRQSANIIAGNSINLTAPVVNVSNDLVVGRDVTIARDLSVGRNTTLQEDLEVKRDAIIRHDLEVDNDTTIKGNSTVKKNMDVSGDHKVEGNSTVKKNMDVSGDHKVEGNMVVVTDLEVKENVTIVKDLRVKEDTIIDVSLKVNSRYI